VQEGLFLYERGLDPYDGGIFHQVSAIASVGVCIGASDTDGTRRPCCYP